MSGRTLCAATATGARPSPNSSACWRSIPVTTRRASTWRGSNARSALRDALGRALLHEPEHVTGDAPHLDFLRAFGDAVATVMAVDVLEGHVARVAEAAMDLHGAVGGFAAQAVG